MSALPRDERALLALPECRLTAEEVAGYRRTGEWRDGSLADHLQRAAEAVPDRVATVGIDAAGGRVTRSLTYAEQLDAAARLAGALAALGIGRGDVVAVMLPNRAEFATSVHAILRLGAVYSGIPSSYGRREAAFILGRTRARVLVTCDRHRGRDFIALVHELRADAPDLETVLVAGAPPQEEGWLAFEDVVAGSAPAARAAVDPGSLAHVGFTSGTTGEPKAVMNTHGALDAILRRWVEHVGAAAVPRGAVNLVASPVGHHTGFLWGALLSAQRAGTGVYLDRWSPDVALQTIREHGVTTLIASPTFLQDLLEVPGATADALPSLRMISIPGAPIPRPVVPRAREQLGCFICPAWGMTEIGIGISGGSGLPPDRVEATDGVAVPGTHVRVMRDDQTPAAPGEEGDLEVAGAGLFAGYLGRPDFTAEAFNGRWFRTGDRALVDADGWVTLCGRTKDIIIRGGENIPVTAVENLIYRHPAVVEAALVAVPDERLGERACACVVTRSGNELRLEDLTGFLLAEGLSRHFLPERLERLPALPKTMSGKVRKTELRAWLGDRASGTTGSIDGT